MSILLSWHHNKFIAAIQSVHFSFICSVRCYETEFFTEGDNFETNRWLGTIFIHRSTPKHAYSWLSLRSGCLNLKYNLLIPRFFLLQTLIAMNWMAFMYIKKTLVINTYSIASAKKKHTEKRKNNSRWK